MSEGVGFCLSQRAPQCIGTKTEAMSWFETGTPRRDRTSASLDLEYPDLAASRDESRWLMHLPIFSTQYGCVCQ